VSKTVIRPRLCGDTCCGRESLLILNRFPPRGSRDSVVRFAHAKPIDARQLVGKLPPTRDAVRARWLRAETSGEPVKRKPRKVEIALDSLQKTCVQCRVIWWLWRTV
jgi:hypothetical protein